MTSLHWLALAFLLALAPQTCLGFNGGVARVSPLAPPTVVLSDRPLIVRQFNPPTNYIGWYERAEKCSGMKGNYQGVTWTVTPEPWGDTTYAEWHIVETPSGEIKRVEITIAARLWLDSTIVIHESLHDILWRNGWTPPALKPGATWRDSVLAHHPVPPFGKCAPIFYPWPKDPT